jgi:hypothetical protein
MRTRVGGTLCCILPLALLLVGAAADFRGATVRVGLPSCSTIPWA